MLKTAYRILLVLILFLPLSCTSEVVVVYDISQERFFEMLEDCEKNNYPYLIIDVRSENEYKLGHIDEAINYPANRILLHTDEFLDFANEIVFVYGHSLNESFKSAELLVEQGFKRLYNVTGFDEATYPLVQHQAIRLVEGFALAREMDYALVDYRSAVSHEAYYVPNTVFVRFPDLVIENTVPFSEGYVVFSTSKRSAKECAKELLDCGFNNVYYCLDNIINYPEYFGTKLDVEDVYTGDELLEINSDL